MANRIANYKTSIKIDINTHFFFVRNTENIHLLVVCIGSTSLLQIKFQWMVVKFCVVKLSFIIPQYYADFYMQIYLQYFVMLLPIWFGWKSGQFVKSVSDIPVEYVRFYIKKHQTITVVKSMHIKLIFISRNYKILPSDIFG